MKIAITGHSAGIGQSFAAYLQSRGHEIIGLSRRNGYNILGVPKVLDHIVDCDMLINNAQSGYSQTELLYEIWGLWKGNPGKWIWNIGTLMTETNSVPVLEGQSNNHVMQYKNQKHALETATRALKTESIWPKIVTIRPGGVATQPGQEAIFPYADPDIWATTVVDLIIFATERNLDLQEIGLGCAKTKIEL